MPDNSSISKDLGVFFGGETSKRNEQEMNKLDNGRG